MESTEPKHNADALKKESVGKNSGSLWYRLWGHRSEKEKKRLRSFIPLFLYTFFFVYGVIYLSILNTVNRNKVGNTVRSWWGDDLSFAQRESQQLHENIERSYKLLRKQVSGGH